MRLFLPLFLFFCVSANAQTVATVTPIAHSMSKALLKNTSISVDFLPPKRLPISRIANWLNKNRNKPQKSYSALININSIRPNLDFYTSLRLTNIRIIPVDIAQALIPAGEKVATNNNKDAFWLNINNSLMMLGILKRDLISIWPEHHQVINQNHQEVATELRQISVEIDELLFTSQLEGIISLSPSANAFANSLMLPIYSEDEVTGQHTLYLSTSERKDSWKIDDFNRYQSVGFLDRWNQNLTNLIKTLNLIKP